MLVTLFGPPGAGKSTLGDRLECLHGFFHIALGRLLKEEAFQKEIGIDGAVVMEAVQTGRTISHAPLFDWLDTAIPESKRPVGVEGYPREHRALPRFNLLAAKVQQTRKLVAAHIALSANESRIRLMKRSRVDD